MTHKQILTLQIIAIVGSVITAGWQILRYSNIPLTNQTVPLLNLPLQELQIDSLHDWTDLMVANNPFRFDRLPPYAHEDQQDQVGSDTPMPVSNRPSLTLLGTIGGEPWQAVIAGIPGRFTPVIMRLGDTLAGYTLRRITTDTVQIAGPDTTWLLVIRGAYQ